jgi:chloramphenicol O-acetyltransferase
MEISSWGDKALCLDWKLWRGISSFFEQPLLHWEVNGEINFFKDNVGEFINDKEKMSFFTKVFEIYDSLKTLESLEWEFEHFNKEELQCLEGMLLSWDNVENIFTLFSSWETIYFLSRLKDLKELKHYLSGYDLAYRIDDIRKWKEWVSLMNASKKEIAEYLWQDYLWKQDV